MSRISSGAAGALSLLVSHICPLFLDLCASSALSTHWRPRVHRRPALLRKCPWVSCMYLNRSRDAGTRSRFRRVINIRLSGLHGNPAASAECARAPSAQTSTHQCFTYHRWMPQGLDGGEGSEYFHARTLHIPIVIMTEFELF